MKISIAIGKEVPEKFPAVLRGDIEGNIKKAKEIGYDAVEIHVENPKLLDVGSVLEILKREKISISTFGTGLAFVKEGLSFTHSDECVREKAIERVKEFMDIAKIFNAKVIIGSIRGKLPEGEKERYENYALECFAKVLEKAEKEEVELLIEPINRYETNFINTTKEALELIEKLSSKYLKIHLDTFHMNIEEENFHKAVMLAGDKLGHIHFADSNRKYPGSGHINFVEVKNALESINYNGVIAFEYLPLPDSETAAVKGLEFVKNLFKN
ncbi:sugar phosphate isomerase/epimerase family protein [Caldanaerobacter subterraneus]|uniref:Sugar phosphate isomerase/epimerase n=1 Tax=Caldanaerobacter subterraneus TaxID=911092 RepID=A0A7Y2PND5_9THEO|nr:sugar phosphate isomerase/epimerase family protein [Caldanaerobacter subterraneus]NNG67646.1 sugar phosphate isomerase/epimerase [Caldanaerobacter subterraneus]